MGTSISERYLAVWRGIFEFLMNLCNHVLDTLYTFLKYAIPSESETVDVLHGCALEREPCYIDARPELDTRTADLE